MELQAPPSQGPTAFSAGLQWHPVAGEQSEQAQSAAALS